MTTAAAPVTRAVSTAFGLVMVASAAVQADGPGLIAAIVAAAAVLVGSVFRPAAAVAVLLTVAVIVLADAPPVLTATSGLCAAAYLVLRHTAAVTVTDSTWRRWVYRSGAGGGIASDSSCRGCRCWPRWPCWCSTFWSLARSGRRSRVLAEAAEACLLSPEFG